MFGNADLDQVLRHQEQFRRDAAQHRLTTRNNRQEPRRSKARRVLGLRLSFA
jgi:hypothetical protein